MPFVTRLFASYRRRLALLVAPGLLFLAAPGGPFFSSTASAASTFNAVDYAQCANGAPPSTSLACPDGWINGILNPNNSHYRENQVTPQRLEVAFDTAAGPGAGGTHSVRISYLDRTGGVHAYDSLATWNHTQTAADRCQGLLAADCIGGSASTYPIPADGASVPPFAAPATSDVVSDHALSGQVFTMYGGTITSTSAITHGANVADSSKEDYGTITVHFTIPAGNTDNNTVQLLFGGHIAAGVGPNGWGTDLGASAISGGNYHIKWIATDGVSIGNRDNQLMSGAVLPAQNTSIVTSASAAPGSAVTVTNSISDSATVSPSNAAGTVVFTAYGPVTTNTPTCTTQVYQSSPQVVTSGSAGPVSFVPSAPGFYFWIAAFTPTDPGLFTPTTGTCGATGETSKVIAASPAITTVASPATGTAGVSGTFGDTATFDNTAVSPTGSVTFTLFSNATCTTTAVPALSGSGAISLVDGSYQASYSNSWTPAQTGTYYWVAHYAGDANNKAFTTGCGDNNEQIVVAAASPAITTVASPATGTAGVSGTFGDTATFDNTAVSPTGSVTFTLFSDATCTTAVAGMSGAGAISSTDGSSQASYSNSWTPPTTGTYYWVAHYAGDANNDAFTTGCGDNSEQIVVAAASPAITTVASPATGTAGVSGTFGDTATFDNTAVSPTGAVTFTLFSNATCTTAVAGMSGAGAISLVGSSYQATYSNNWKPSAAGTYRWVAHYAGDVNNDAFTTGCGDNNEQVVIAAAVAVLGEKVVRQPPAATLPFTGAVIPLQLASTVALGLVGVGVTIVAMMRRRNRRITD